MLFKTWWLISFCFSLLLAGCSTNPAQPPTKVALSPLQTLYDYHLIDSQTKQPIHITELAKRLKDMDVIFIGEFHGNQASHLLQAQLQSLLYQQRPDQILSMEQFNRDQQTILNRYLDGEIGEKTLIKEAPTWSNYAGSYRPLVEFSKQHFLPVIAANAPAQTVRCIGRQGQDYLTKLTEDERQQVAEQAFYSDPAYKAKFDEFLKKSRPTKSQQPQRDGKAPNNQKRYSYLAQLARDNTMAESIQQALQRNPNAQVIHTNGAFHSDEWLGTVSALKHLNPHLKIAVISPVRIQENDSPSISSEDLNKGDFIYLIQPQPQDYVQAAKRRAAFKKMFDKADAKPCR